MDKIEPENNNLNIEKLQTYDVSNLEEEPEEKPTQPINDTTSQFVSQKVENKAIMETASDTTIELNHSSLSKPTPLQYPPLFIREFGIISEQKNAIKSLYDLLDANGYIRCSSLEYFVMFSEEEDWRKHISLIRLIILSGHPIKHLCNG